MPVQDLIDHEAAPDRLTPGLAAMQQIRVQVERRLEALAPRAGPLGDRVAAAVRYSLLGGGKRLRPVLTVLTTRTLGGAPSFALDPACAVEMVHTASLILDDLPCMDDASERRGKPANHRAFGEDIANLAAVTLISEAFGVIARSRGLSAELRAELVALLANTIGLAGLAGGQAGDLAGAPGCRDQESLERMEAQKTGALFVTSVQMGARIAGATQVEVDALSRFARDAGLAFQIFDDLLDACADAGALGKDVHQDGSKTTFGTLMSRAAAEALALERCRTALRAVADLRRQHQGLAAFLDAMIDGYRRQAGEVS